MASSSSSAQLVHQNPQEDIAPLPLIRCPRCNLGVTQWFISNTVKNPGRHFYKCEYNRPGGCTFWKWENEYIDYFRARWGHIFMTVAPAHNQVQGGGHAALVLEIRRELRNILLVGFATPFGVLILVGAKA